MKEQAAPTADILDLPFSGLVAQLAVWKEPRYRAQQLWTWLYVHLADDYGQMSNLPQSLREQLSRLYRLSPLTPMHELTSRDKLTRKVLFQLPDGHTVESVLMEYDRRHTVCVSSQVGCPVGCGYCATGQSGFVRHLSAAEIVSQALYFARELGQQGRTLSNIVVMGMGEPLLNYDAVWQAVETWNDHRGFDLGARRITLSTAGHVPGIRRLANESLQVRLAVSLHAAADELRDQLVPLNRTYPLADLLAACRDYVALTNRRITIEYALIDQVNDSAAHAHQLAGLLRGLLCHINLIPLNATEGIPYLPSPRERVLAFRDTLQEHHVPTTVRLGRGIDIQAGCGQLRQRRRIDGNA